MSDTVKSMQVGIVGVLLVLLTSAVVAQVSMASSAKPFEAVRCIPPQKRLIADGRSPGNKRWTVTAAIRNNGNCRAWLLSMDFRPLGTLRGSSRWAWMIPADGHLSRKFTINAQDESADSDRVFYGAVGLRVKSIKLIMSNGKRVVVRPKLPSLALRERFVWLRNVQYVLRYYSAGEHVRVAKLFNARGGVVDGVRGQEGEFS